MKKLLVIMILFNLFILVDVAAHPGRTDSNGCHTCKKNCSSWGLQTGEYHCHNGSSSTTPSVSEESTYSPTITPTVKEVVKSSDNTLKTLIINGESIDIKDKMNYKTKKEQLEIEVKPNDGKATCTVNNKPLIIGENIIDIEVVAEDGSIKHYTIKAIREKLSNNTNIEVAVLGEKVTFVDNKASIDVANEVEKLDYSYKLEDENAKVSITGSDELNEGANVIEFKVTAEDGTEQIYELTVNRDSDNIIIDLFILGGCGYGIYRFWKRRKKVS